MSAIERKALAGKCMTAIGRVAGREPYSSTGKVLIAAANAALAAWLNGRGIRYAESHGQILISVTSAQAAKMLG